MALRKKPPAQAKGFDLTLFGTGLAELVLSAGLQDLLQVIPYCSAILRA